MPGRATPPIVDQRPPSPSSACASVPAWWPAAGCTTMPAGLSITTRSGSSYTIGSGMASATGSSVSATGGSYSSRSPGRTASEGRPGRPFTAT